MNRIHASIIIPVYNCEPYLAQCLESALGQSEHDIEIVCVDNQSTDGSHAILEEYASQDKRIVILSEHRQGVTFARNTGIEAARGKYLFFLDSDDFVEPDMVECVTAKAETAHAEMTIFSFDEYYTKDNAYVPRERCEEESLYHRSFTLKDLEGASTGLTTPNATRIAFDASWLRQEDLRFPTEISTAEDLVFVNRTLFRSNSLALMPDCFYHYRRDVGSSITRKDRKGDSLVALELIKEELDEQRPQKPWLERHFANIVVDTLEYQIGSCATAEEYAQLYRGWTTVWRPYVLEHDEFIMPRYARFMEGTASSDGLGYLFYLFCTARDDREHLIADMEGMRRELDVVKSERDTAARERDEISSSTSFRLGHALISPVAKLIHR